MKSKLFKKLIAGVATLAMVAQLGFVMPASAEGTGTETDPFYLIDFEGDTAGDKVWGYSSASANVTGVKSADELVTYYVGSGNRYSGNIKVATDATYKNYAAVNAAAKFSDADSNNKRAPSIQINNPKSLSEISEGKACIFKFNFKTSSPSGAIYLNDDTDLPAGDFIKISMEKMPTNTWLTAYLTINIEKKMCLAEIYNGTTAVDAQTNFYTTTGNPARLRFLGGSYDYSIDNISVYEVTPPVKYQVTYSILGKESKEIVNENEAPVSIPDTASKGRIFDGWLKDTDTETVYSTEQVAAMTITADTVFTAVYHDDPAYQQSIAKVEFVNPKGDAITQPEEGAVDEYTYTVKITSDIGNDITDKCDITWNIVGNEADDNYTHLIPQTDVSSAKLTVGNGVGNYYGYIKANATYPKAEDTPTSTPDGISFVRSVENGVEKNIVTVKNDADHADLASATLIYAQYDGTGALKKILTYPLTFTDGVATQEIEGAVNGAKLMVWKSLDGESAMVPVYAPAEVSGAVYTTGQAQTPYAILGRAETENIVPQGGYPVDFSEYPDSLVGYKATAEGLTDKDLVLNGWSIYGSNAARDLELVKDEATGKKALKFSATGGNRGGTGSSTVGVYQWAAQSVQYTIEAVIKGGSLGVYSNTPNNNNAVTQCAFEITGGSLTAGTSSVAGVSSDSFYKVLMSCDPAVGKYYVKVYDLEGNLVGETDTVDCGTGADMKYLCVYGSFPVEIRSLRAYKPAVSTLTINSDDTLKVPEAEGDPDLTYDLSATCLDADGNKILGDVTWSLAEEYSGVELTQSGQTAQLKLSYGAGGTITVNASNGSATKAKEIMLTTSSNVVLMTGDKSVTIPFEGTEVKTYTAKTIDKDQQDVAGDEITFSFLAKDGSTPLATLPNGVTFDAETGKLTVAAGATPAVIYLKATNKEGLTNKIRINIHGMSFDFGTDDPEEGYTQVTADTQYTESLGMGFEAVTGLTAAADNVGGSAAYKFKVNVPNGNYNVAVATTSASMLSEAVSGSATGVTKSGTNFKVAVCDGVLDLTFAADSNVSSLVVSQDTAKVQQAKPSVYAIGDSTTKNSGHYSGYDPATATDHREYASWGNCVVESMYGDTFASFRNDGMAGRNSVQFYNEGRIESVLLAIAPGDYVTVNMGINGSESSSEFRTLMEDYCVKAIIQRGAIPVIVTATPDGPVGSSVGSNYNSVTGKFTNNRGTGARNGILRSIAQDNNLNIIELGYWGQEWMNTLTTDDLDKANTANKDVAGYVAPTTVLGLVQSWYTDHNHYTRELGTVIATYMFDCLQEIAGGSTDFNQANDPHITEQ